MVSLPPILEAYVTNYVPRTVLKLIASENLTFDKRPVVYSVEGQCRYKTSRSRHCQDLWTMIFLPGIKMFEVISGDPFFFGPKQSGITWNPWSARMSLSSPRARMRPAHPTPQPSEWDQTDGNLSFGQAKPVSFVQTGKIWYYLETAEREHVAFVFARANGLPRHPRVPAQLAPEHPLRRCLISFTTTLPCGL